MGGSKPTIINIKGVYSKEPQAPSQINTLFLGCEEMKEMLQPTRSGAVTSLDDAPGLERKGRASCGWCTLGSHLRTLVVSRAWTHPWSGFKSRQRLIKTAK